MFYISILHAEYISPSISNMTSAQILQDKYEIRPDPQTLTHNTSDPAQNSKTDVDSEPHPEQSVPTSAENEKIVNAITSLYSGSASKEDMEVYAEKAIYDDPWSYCDTRYKVAGQWYGRLTPPPLFDSSVLSRIDPLPLCQVSPRSWALPALSKPRSSPRPRRRSSTSSSRSINRACCRRKLSTA